MGKKSCSFYHIIGCICCLAIVIIALVVTWLFVRAEDIPIIETQAQESLPSIVAAGTINEFDGFVRIDSTFDLSDQNNINYYLTIENVDMYPTNNEEEAENVSLYLTTFTDMGSLLFNEYDDEDIIIIPNVNKALLEEKEDNNDDIDSFFPYRLPNNYMPETHRLAVFVTESQEKSDVEIILGTVDLKLAGQTNNSNNNDNTNSNMDNNNGDENDTVNNGNTNPDDTNNGDDGDDNNDVSGNNDSTNTDGNNNNNNSETDSSNNNNNSNSNGNDEDEEIIDLPILNSNLIGTSYKIEGTISIQYRTDFINGNFQEVPVLKFDNIIPPSAPGPFLYLSPRSLDDTKGGRPDLDNGDIYIPLDESNDGSFSVRGTFFQDFDELNDDVETINNYMNGSWLIWCEPFRVYLGGGQITVE